MADAARPTPDRTADIWANECRKLPENEEYPGDWDSWRTPYTIPPMRAHSMPGVREVITVMFSQGGKTAYFLNVAGKWLDDGGQNGMGNVIFMCPGADMIRDEHGPKFDAMLDSAESLSRKSGTGHDRKQLLKKVGPVTLRLATTNSASRIASASAILVLVDEIDKAVADRREGSSVWAQARARGGARSGFIISAVSTPTRGVTTTYVHPVTGMRHWNITPEPDEDNPDEIMIESRSWRLWERGSRHQTAMPCPHCGEFFIPYMGMLRYPEKTPLPQIRKSTWIECPSCEKKIEPTNKKWMMTCSVPIAPGQKARPIDLRIVEDDVRKGAPVAIDEYDEDENIIKTDAFGFGSFVMPSWAGYRASFQISGLHHFGPDKGWGDLAQDLAEAKATGDPEEEAGVLNLSGGELYTAIGERMPVADIYACAGDYSRGHVSDPVTRLSLGVDLGDFNMWWRLRGHAAGGTSYLIDWGELTGDTGDLTQTPEIWTSLLDLIQSKWDDHGINVVGIDSGDHKDSVYAFCRPRYKRPDTRKIWCIPTKGGWNLTRKYVERPTDETYAGKPKKRGMHLLTFDTHAIKYNTRQRIEMWARRFADDPTAASLAGSSMEEMKEVMGAWFVPREVKAKDPDGKMYAQHMTAEEYDPTQTGKKIWNARSRANHLWDCEMIGDIVMTRYQQGVPIPSPDQPKRRRVGRGFISDQK